MNQRAGFGSGSQWPSHVDPSFGVQTSWSLLPRLRLVTIVNPGDSWQPLHQNRDLRPGGHRLWQPHRSWWRGERESWLGARIETFYKSAVRIYYRAFVIDGAVAGPNEDPPSFELQFLRPWTLRHPECLIVGIWLEDRLRTGDHKLKGGRGCKSKRPAHLSPVRLWGAINEHFKGLQGRIPDPSSPKHEASAFIVVEKAHGHSRLDRELLKLPLEVALIDGEGQCGQCDQH